MTEAEAVDRLAETDAVEGEDMAELVCDHCGQTRTLEMRHSSHLPGEVDILRGTLTCRSCGGKTIFGMQGNAINFYPTKGAYGELSQTIPPKVRHRFLDAELAFYGGSLGGAVAMARSTVEVALEQRGFTQGTLEDQIDAAEAAGALDKTQSMLAHGSRLAGNDALHRAETIEPGAVPPALSASISIANHLFP